MADYVSVLTGGSNSFATTSEHLNALQTDLLIDGVVGSIGNTAGVAPMTGGLATNAQGTPDMTVAVTAGKCYVTATPTSQGSQRLRANIATQNVTISANATGGTRYDWVYVTISAANAANPNVSGTNVVTLTTSRSTSSATDNGTPPTYGYAIAVVTVANGAASITNGNITDKRVVTTLSATSTTDGWLTGEATPNTVTALGNRSYSLVFNSTDLTDTLSSGMRLKMARTVTAPTLCTDLESGSSQYYKKVTPNKLTFTDDFVCSAWIKIESYPTTGNITPIISRSNGTSGWMFWVNEWGQLVLNGHNAAIGNYSRVTCYQAVPVGRWVFVAAQLDMSAFTATTTTSYVMIDGLDVPAAVTRAGTNPTALIQAGDLNIGQYNSGTANSYFDGKIAQVAVYNAKVTQATVLASMTQALTGSETSLASAYSFNNSITDLNTTTPNDLTAVGSAVATATDTPFTGGATGTTEYGIITAASFSTNTTLTVQVPEGYAIPTSGGVSALSYSTQKVPYGFPASASKWEVISIQIAQGSQGAAVDGTWYNVASHQMSVPVGDWDLGYEASPIITATTFGIQSLTLSTANNSESDFQFRTQGYIGGTNTTGLPRYRARTINITAATLYYLNHKQESGTGVTLFTGINMPAIIFARFTYL